MDPIQIIIQVLLGIVIAAVGFIVNRLAGDIEKFTINMEKVAEKITSLELEMIKDFVLKEDLIPIKNRMTELLSREEMTMLRTQVQKIAADVFVLMAKAELHRRKGEDDL